MLSTTALWILVPLCIVVILLIVWFGVLLLLVAPGKYPKNDPARLLSKDGSPTPIAHRGLHDREHGVPENSLAAFGSALEHGYGVELDLNLTTDDQVVVFHDDTLTRMCGDDRKVCECSYAELQELSLDGTEEKIPLFTEVLERMGGKQTMIVELKDTPRRELLCEKAYELLKSYDGPYCIESFHPAIVAWFRKHAPEVVRGQLAMGRRHYDKFWQGFLMSASLTNISTRPHFSAFHYVNAPSSLTQRLYRLLGGKAVAWTIRDPKDYQLYTRYFDVIIFEGAGTPGSPDISSGEPGSPDVSEDRALSAESESHAEII